MYIGPNNNHMPWLVKDREVVTDRWRLATETAPDYVEHTIVPLADIREGDTQGVWINSDTELEDVIDHVSQLDLIAIEFGGFADGRGLSVANLLRTRYKFKGEIRAIGHVEPDLTPFMQRCGFDAYVFSDRQQAETAINCMSTMTNYYQGSAVQPQPSYRRVNRS